MYRKSFSSSVFNSIIKKFDGVQDLEVLDVSHMSRKVIKHGTTDVPIEYYYTEISMKNVDKWYAIESLIDKLNIEKNRNSLKENSYIDYYYHVSIEILIKLFE